MGCLPVQNPQPRHVPWLAYGTMLQLTEPGPESASWWEECQCHIVEGLVYRNGKNRSYFWKYICFLYILLNSSWQEGRSHFPFLAKLGTCQRNRGVPGMQERVHRAQPLLCQVGSSSYCGSQRWCPGWAQDWKGGIIWGCRWSSFSVPHQGLWMTSSSLPLHVPESAVTWMF